MSVYRKFAGQTLIYGVSTILSRMIAFALTPVYARALPVGGNGIFTAMYGYASIINAILAFGMETTFFRYLQKRDDDRETVYNNSFGAVFVVSMVFLAFSLFFLDDVILFLLAGDTGAYRDYKFYVQCFLAILVTDAVCVIPFARLRAEGRPVRFGVVKCLNIFIVVFFNVFFLFIVPFMISRGLPGGEWMAVWYRPKWVGYVFLSNLFASALTVLLLLPELLKLRLHFNMRMFLQMLNYSWPILIANISFIINESLDKAMLKHMLPIQIADRDVAIYGMCAKIALFLNLFVQAFRLGAEPFFFSQSKNSNSGETYARIMDYFVITVAVISVALVANVDLLASVIVGAETRMVNGTVINNVYWTGLNVIPPLIFGYMSLGIYMNLSVWYKLSDQTRFGLYISGIGALVTILLNWIFIPEYSYMASAWASVSAYAIMMILSYVLGQRHYPIPYHIRKNTGYMLAAILIVFLSFNIFNRNIYIGNMLLLVFAGTAVYLERKGLKAFLKGK